MSFRIDQLAVLNLVTVGNSVTAGSFVRSGGTAAQFLMADGSVSTNPGWLTSITSNQVTTALGYTPYNATNPNGYITSSGSISGSAGSVAWTNVTGRPSALSSFTNDIVARTTLSASGDFQFGGQDLAQNNFSLSSATTDTDQFGRYYYSGTSGSIWSRYLPVDKSGKYRLKIRWKASAASGTYMAVILLDTSGNNINGAGTYWAYPWSGSGAPTSWTTNEYWYDGSSFPANAAYVAFGISHTNYGGGSATYYVSQLEIERYHHQISGNNIWHSGNLTNLNQLSNGPGYITSSGSITGDAGSVGGISVSRIVYGDNSTATTYISNATLDGALKSGFYTVGSGGIPNATSVNFVLHTAYYGVGNLAGFDLACNDSTTSQFYLRPATGGGKGSWQTIVTNSGTWGISITGNAATVGGYSVSGSVGANTVVIRDSNNYIYAYYINSSVSESENPTINSFFTSNGDGWLRKSSLAHVRSQLGNYGGWITGYTETDTLATVTARGASTSTAVVMSGGSGTTPTLSLDRNIASPSNYYNGVQLEIKATSGTAGIGLHRSGFSHVGIYHDTTNVLKFDMNSGSVTLNHNTGTIWGSGNLTNLNQLTNGPGYITASYGGFATRQDGTRYTTNYNSILSSGFFNGEGQPTNAPNGYGQLIVAKGADTGLQIAGGYSSNNLYFRGWGYGPEADGFHPWRTVWHNGNLSNLNQLTNGPGYITSSALSSYLPLSGGIVSGILQARRNQSDNNYTTAALWTESYGTTTTGIAFHISGVVGKFLEMRTNGVLYWENGQVWTSSNLTNLNQLSNGPGYITSAANWFGAETTSGTTDWNHVTNTRPGTGYTLLLGSHTNGFGVGNYYHSFNLEYSSKSGGGNITQFAISYGSPGNDFRMRGRYDGSWSSWLQFLNSGNYNSYSPTLTGGGASGTWGINVTGTAGSISGYNNPTTSATANTIAYRDSVGDITVRELVLNVSVQDFTPSSMVAIYPTTNQAVKVTASGARAFLNVPTRTGGDASGTWGINVTGTAGSTAVLTASGSLTTQQGNGTVIYTYAITNPQSGLFSASDNANSILTVNRHPGNYYSQLGFSSNGNLYYRNFVNTAINTSQGWQTIWTSSSLTNLNQLSNGPGYITSSNNVVGLYSSGWGYDNFTWYQTSGGLAPYTGSWASFLVSNHGNGSNYYNQTIIMPFWGVPQYSRREGGNNVGPWTFWTTENLNPNSISGNFYASGSITAGGDVTAYSDARVKENVHTVENALDKTLRMRGVTYNRTDSDDKKTKVGVIAQEMLEVLPEVVNQDNAGMYNVSYGNIVGVLIEAIKEQQQQIEDLKSKLDALT